MHMQHAIKPMYDITSRVLYEYHINCTYGVKKLTYSSMVHALINYK